MMFDTRAKATQPRPIRPGFFITRSRSIFWIRRDADAAKE
jgi:hypothetical protein